MRTGGKEVRRKEGMKGLLSLKKIVKGARFVITIVKCP